jgi:hypothetical protein
MDYSDKNRDAPVLVYDTATGALAVGPATPADLQYVPKLVAAGDRWLYALDGKVGGGGGDHLMALEQHDTHGSGWISIRDAPWQAAGMVEQHQRRAGPRLPRRAPGRLHRLLLGAREGHLLAR